MFAKALKLARLAAVPSFIRGLRYGVAATVEHRNILAPLKINTVVDVGANKGQFALLARHLYPDAIIYAFEPLPGPASRLERLFKTDSRMRLARCAIGCTNGKATIHLSKREDSSSLLPIGEAQVAHYPNTQEIGTVEIQVSTLDQLLTASEIIPDALMKIDVQGYEGQVIEGSERLLQHFRFVYCEVSFVQLYDGQELAHQVIGRLAAHGFRLRGVTVSSSVQADMLFDARH